MTDVRANQFYDDVASVDFETFWDKDFTLSSKSMSMTDYIRDPRFEAQTCAVQLWDWDKPEVAVGPREIGDLLHSVDWSRTAFLAHHTHFDGLISTELFNIAPVFWLDTLSMSRTLFGVDVNHSFNALGARLGMTGKTKDSSIKETKGLYLRDMTPEQISAICGYNVDDCADTLQYFKRLGPLLPFDELRIIDLTLRMYCEPVLELDEQRLRELHARETDRRARLIEEAETSADVLGSAPKFADLLRSLGVVPPMKMSKRTGQPTYAFAKTDLEFVGLLSHPNEAVRIAVQARLGNKGSIVESRSKRLLGRVGRPTPVYLAPAAARTLRWGGGDLSNWQNLPSTGDGANIRKAIMAPEGCQIVAADASQVEARMVAFLSNFDAKIKAFSLYDAKLGPDMYCVSAEGVYGRPIDAKLDPFERFIGKVLELSCQYGAGAVRVKHTLAQGFRGAPPVIMDLQEVQENIARWRSANKPVCDTWGILERAAKSAWLQGREVDVGPVTFELFKDDGYIHFPNGTFMKYPRVGWDSERRSLYYNSRNGVVHLWGGHLLENVSQGLCAVLLKEQLLRMTDEMPDLRLVLLVHDEAVSVVENENVELYASNIKRIMSTPAQWTEGRLPLNAGVAVGPRYEKP